MQLASLLDIHRGVTAIIGSGGKTTLLESLARELSAQGSVIACTSTRIYPIRTFPLLTEPNTDEIRSLLKNHHALCVGSRKPEGKLGAPGLSFSALAALADYVLVEADGAKRLPLKAHLPYEPVIPENAARVVLVVGASGFNQPIREVCHRPERFAELAGTDVNALATPERIAEVLNAEGLGDCVLVNQAESAAALAGARELAEQLTCPVMAGSLQKGELVCLR